MIALYHGGSDIIRNPEIREPNRTLDFGIGFYLTSSKTQASNWVRRRIGNDRFKGGYVNEYKVDFEAATTLLNIKIFESPNDEWLDFVMSNRRINGFSHDYDIVIGPVANDRDYTAFALYEGGTISRDTLISELRTYRLVDQYLFHTDEALKFLKFTNAEKVKI